ncbi:MAG: hypothetical protein BAJATHORv1_30247 [Candidatus Thorarchaeota archaeon]|nr:MAG: hypothetical protein BAJATHORv1_30247 [Candidatus Thorarchaeota archaeon]
MTRPRTRTPESPVHVIVQIAKSKQRAPKIPESEEVEKIAKGVYRIFGKPERHKHHFHDIPHIAFRRTKEIPSTRSKSLDDVLRRTYALVVYRYENPTAQQKKRTQRLIRRSPCIRLRPGVLVFPHLKAKQMSKVYQKRDKTKLFTAKEFASKMEEFGAKVIRWGRLKISGPRSFGLLEQSLKNMIESEEKAIVDKFKQLKKEAKNSEVSIKKLKERYRELSGRYKLQKTSCEVIREVWKFDCEKQLRRVYNIMLQTRRAISEQQSSMKRLTERETIEESSAVDHQSS